MVKRLVIILFTCAISQLMHAQWNGSDSLGIRPVLNGEGEIRINQNAVRQIDFSITSPTPLAPLSRPALRFDETLPEVYPDRDKVTTTLNPYQLRTISNYDPVTGERITVPNNLPWLKSIQNSSYLPSNWAKNWRDGTLRNSLDQIEAAGVKYRMFTERVNNMNVGTSTIVSYDNSINLGNGITSTITPAGGSIGGVDLMAPFTKDFWDRRGRNRRARTLQVLRTYGDSTTVLINEPLILISR